MNKLWMGVVTAALCGQGALAADHLVPQSNSLADYQAMVRAVFKGAYEADVRARVIGEPSFEPEFAVGIREVAGTYVLFSLKPAAHIWDYTLLRQLRSGHIVALGSDGLSHQNTEIKRLESRLPADPSHLMVEQCTAPIDAALARGMLDVWSRMLAQTRPDESKTIGLDGETFNFSMELDQRTLSGETWSPNPQSKPGKLVGMVMAMRHYCTSRKAGDVAVLASLTRDLQTRLPSGTPSRS